jgi:phosphoglycerate dehydrogenase-like enzyme
MKAILHYNAGETFGSALEAARPDWLDIAIVPERDHARLARELADADVLLHVLEPATAAMISSAPRLRLIQKIGVGGQHDRP